MAAKQVAPGEFRCDQPLPRGVEQPSLFTLHHSVRLMIMAAIARFLLGRQSQTFFSSSTRIPCERPLSCHQLTDDEIRFVQAHLAEWPKQFQAGPSAFFSERSMATARSDPSVHSVQFLSTFQLQICPVIKHNPSGI
jgi:hypothetical protein